MTETTVSGSKSNPITATNNQGVPWAWDLNKDTFFVDPVITKQIFGREYAFNSIHDLLDKLTLLDKKRLTKAFDLDFKALKNDTAHVTIRLPTMGFTFVQITITKRKKGLYSGLITPLLHLDNQHKATDLLHHIFENTHFGVIITDSRSNILICNNFFQSLSGYSEEELIGKNTNIFNAKRHDKTLYQQMWQSIADTGSWHGIILSRRKDGDTDPQELTIQRLELNEQTYYLGLVKPLQQQVLGKVDIEQGGIDLVTQLPTKEPFLANIHKILNALADGRNTMLLVFEPYLDEENFNEEKKLLADALSKATNYAKAGYIGDNRFAVIMLFQLDIFKEDHNIAQTIRGYLSAVKKRLDLELFIKLFNTNIGISVYGVDAKSEQELLEHAELALNQPAGQLGKKLCYYDEMLHEKLLQQLHNKELLIRMIADKTVDVFYQPIVSTSDWQVVKFEALARFRDEGKLLDTQEMIFLLEEMDKISDIDQQVAHKAIRTLPALQKLFGAHVAIGINLSLNTTTSLDVITKYLIKTVTDAKVSFPQVTVELTENACFGASTAHIVNVQRLREKGIKVAIDDFGTGYSSLSYLRESHFSFIKIDKSFVENITSSASDYEIVHMSVKLAQLLRIKVIAEGVETLAQVKLLKELGVEYLQGYYFSPPVPLSELHTVAQRIGSDETLSQLTSKNELHSLISHVASLPPEATLAQIMALMAQDKVEAVPIVNEKRCVGIVDLATLNLHISARVGTDAETAADLHDLNKHAHQAMRVKFETVMSNFQESTLRENIQKQKPFPWVVIDDFEHYKGIIFKDEVIRYLA
ncbi:EAL domain-containing protein [Corallincola holothuriorum]|uniref:EAL domain-containing protein n=1 Tax=Corallincola holothuriorum TaxID=2282215 RepID=A0A368NKS6_9GAMM|nr:EAL domain-containing protein [Corallincola holothuriorum]RCU49931.1 EAL domain-containing protein [Corallincola holothuriorum]